jgi:hypothetical protein
MPTEIEQAVARARQQSESFMQQSRAQMYQVHQEQRAQMMGSGPQQAGTMAQHPQMGTPAGRLMETITALVRRGSQMGSAAIAPVGQMAAGIGAGIGGGAGFASSTTPFGVGGVEGGAAGASRGLGFWQTAFTAYGGALPLGMGKFAGQRLDMSRRQAQVLAREEMSYRLAAGAREGSYDALNSLSMGLMGATRRRTGTEFEARDLEYFTRFTQRQMRHVRAGALEEAGLGDERGVTGTGVTRGGARAYARAVAREMGSLQAETGLSREQATGLLSAAGTLMGGVQVERFAAQGPQAYGKAMGKGARDIKDIRQTLNLAEDEYKQFFDTLGEMYGSTERVKAMANQAKSQSARFGMNRRAVFEMSRQFEDMGRQMGMGGAATGAAMMEQVAGLRGMDRMGGMSRDEMFRYSQPGASAEQALQDQARTRMQQNLGMWGRGRLGGIGMMATQDSRTFEKFMGGGMGYMQMVGAVGTQMAKDPLSMIRAKYDPNQHRMMGQLGARIAYQSVQAMRDQGMFGMFGAPEQQRLMSLHQFVQKSGLAPLEGRQRYEQFEREQYIFEERSKDKYEKDGGRTPAQHGSAMGSIHNKLLAAGAAEVSMSFTGASSPMEAAEKIYDIVSDGGKNEIPDDMPIEDLLKAASGKAGVLSGGEGSEAIGKILGGGLIGAYMTREYDPNAPKQTFWNADKYNPPSERVLGERRVAARKALSPGNLKEYAGALRRKYGVTGKGMQEVMFGKGLGMSLTRDTETWVEKIPGAAAAGRWLGSLVGRGGKAPQVSERISFDKGGFTRDGEPISFEEIESRYGADQAENLKFEVLNRLADQADPEKFQELMDELDESGGRIGGGKMAYREWVRGRGAGRLRGILGSDLGGIATESMDFAGLMKIVASGDEPGSMTAGQRAKLGVRLRQSGAYENLMGFQSVIGVAGDVTSRGSQFKWQRQHETADKRASAIRVALGVSEANFAPALAKMFNQAEVSFAGVEAGKWDKDNIKRMLDATKDPSTGTEEQFIRATALGGTKFGKEIIDSATGVLEKVATTMPTGAVGSELNVKLAPDNLGELARAIGDAVEP